MQIIASHASIWLPGILVIASIIRCDAVVCVTPQTLYAAGPWMFLILAISSISGPGYCKFPICDKRWILLGLIRLTVPSKFKFFSRDATVSLEVFRGI